MMTGDGGNVNITKLIFMDYFYVLCQTYLQNIILKDQLDHWLGSELTTDLSLLQQFMLLKDR
jgi:hypothetical protein